MLWVEGACVLALLLMRHFKPCAVWIVAPVAMPTSLGDVESSKENLDKSMMRATAASIMAN